MKTPRLRSRTLGVLAATAVTALATSQAAQAAPVRTATTTKYTTATYLQHALGLPATDTNPAIEPVTFDRFQWLLQQSGNIAVLIGDPAKDANFKARAQDTEAAALAAGAKKVYWFNPNLSGSAKVGTITEPNLDIRNPAGITSLAAASQTKYDNAWRSLVGDYLGNGLKITHNGLNSESATVTVATDATAANDAGTTEVDGTPGALYGYTAGVAPTTVQDSFFFVYNKDATSGGKAAKVAAWTDLTKQPDSAAAKVDVTKAIAKVGGANVAAPSEFGFWKDEVNAKQLAQAGSSVTGLGSPVLSDADATDGWKVNQITYPELVDLLDSGADTANAVILFGGTWCPNTRPVLPAINKYAQQNDVQVFNFDTVLDGGLVGDATTSAVNPLQSRNTQDYTPRGGTTVDHANPTSLYGDLVSKYLKNIKTEYAVTGTSVVSYYPGGDSTPGTSAVVKAPKLQVPFLVGYQKDAAGAGVQRQWIIDKGDGTYTEYMSTWSFTNPQPGQIGLSATQLPPAAPIWATINNQLKTVTWDTDPKTLVPNTAIDTDDTQFLVDGDTATVTYTPAAGSTPATAVGTSGGASPVPAGAPALASALLALGSSAPATLEAAKSAYIANETAATPDANLRANLKTVVGAWSIARTRKGTLLTRWGTKTSPSSVLGGLAAVHYVDVFFGGLPGPVVTDPGTGTTPGTDPGTTPITTPVTPVATPSVIAPVQSIPVPVAKPTPVVLKKVSKVKGAVVKAPTHKKAGKYKVSITVPKGASAAAGKVTVKLKKGAVTKTLTGKLAKGVVTVTVPKLAKGTWKVTIVFPGDAHYAKTSVAGTSIKVKK